MTTEGSIERPPAEAICAALPDAVLFVGRDGRIKHANERVSTLFGYEPDELAGETIEVLVPDESADEHVDYRESYLADPEVRPMGAGLDLLGQRKDGSTFPVDVSLSPIAIDGEEGVVAAVRDVSEHEALRTKYRALLETAPDGFFVADAATGELVEVNDRAAELTGYPKETLVGMHQADLHPSDETDRYREHFERHAEADGIRSTLPDGSPIYIERRDGELVPVEINARSFQLGDRKLVTGAFRDVSGRRERERALERAETVVQATGDAVYMLDSDGRFTFVNEALERLSGYEESRLLGEDVSVVMEDADIEKGRSLIADLLEGDRDRGTFEMTVHTADGREVPTENHVAIVENERGKLEASVGVVRDISERKARQRELERENQRLDEFAGVVSHDLRSPLNVARGRLELAREDCDNEHLERVADAHRRMEEMIQQTLALARNGEIVGETQPVDLARLARESWGNVDTGDATLYLESPPTVGADPSRLGNLFENLFRNSVEHGSAGPPSQTREDSVEPGSRTSSEDAVEHRGEAVSITVGGIDGGFYVEDDGPGIPAGVRDSVFEAGYSSTVEGTGFGLAIVNRIVEAHDWSIDVTDGRSGGARFEITGVGVEETSGVDQ